MSEECVTIKVVLSVDDYISLQKNFIKKSKLTLILALFIVFASLFRSIDRTSSSLSLSIFFIVLVLIGLWVLIPIKMKKVWTQQYNSNKLLQCEQTFIIKPTGLERFSETESAQLTWKDIYAYSENAQGFLIYISNIHAYYIPKKAIENDDNKINLIRSHLSNLKVYKEKSVVPNLVKIYLIGFVCILLILFIARLS